MRRVWLEVGWFDGLGFTRCRSREMGLGGRIFGVHVGCVMYISRPFLLFFILFFFSFIPFHSPAALFSFPDGRGQDHTAVMCNFLLLLLLFSLISQILLAWHNKERGVLES